MHRVPHRVVASLAMIIALGADAAEMTDILREELQRASTLLAKEQTPLYFLSYEIVDQQQIFIGGNFGALVANASNSTRLLDIDLRVGSHELDNTRQILTGSQASALQTARGFRRVNAPIDADALAIKHILWRETDNEYRQAAAQLTRIKANQRVSVESKDASHDFSREPAVKFAAVPPRLELDRSAWADKLRRLSAPFAKHEFIQNGGVTLRATRQQRWYANSDDSTIADGSVNYEVVISASARADDGMVLPRYQAFYANDATQLPSEEALLAVVARMIDDIKALRAAPLVEPFTGPAIFSGRAAGVFFHEVLGHRMEGHRIKDVRDGQTFKDKLNTAILPDSVSVYADPTLKHTAGIALNGHYLYDNEGVAARRVTLVEAGVLKNFLMSRTPIAGFSNSNGHGRKQSGYSAVSRQSNLVVTTQKAVTRAALKRQLLDLVKVQAKPYGLLFDDIQGGFTFTGRGTPNAFNVAPRMVYRLYPDGREELVRGVDLIGTPLTALSKIVAMDNEPAVFNGTCGAESGGVPVSAIAPGMLISQIEVQRTATTQQRLPLLPNPVTASAE